MIRWRAAAAAVPSSRNRGEAQGCREDPNSELGSHRAIPQNREPDAAAPIGDWSEDCKQPALEGAAPDSNRKGGGDGRHCGIPGLAGDETFRCYGLSMPTLR